MLTKYLSEIDISKVRRLIREALREDIGSGDVTANAIVGNKKIIYAEIISKEQGVIGGIPVAREVFHLLDPKVEFIELVKEGDVVEKDKKIVSLRGNARAILMGERVALNFMQRISGIATETRGCTDKIKKFKTVILDTRKTPAGWRYLDKYAVRLGGGQNHRFGLYDMVLIKDNHLACVRSITEAVMRARERYPDKKVEIEVKNFRELREALKAEVDIVMLDNMDIEKISKAVRIIDGKCRVEVSGNVRFSMLYRLAKLGVDYISLGRLTHSPRALDLSLKVIGDGCRRENC